jgi:hypothetical protein
MRYFSQYLLHKNRTPFFLIAAGNRAMTLNTKSQHQLIWPLRLALLFALAHGLVYVFVVPPW